MEKNFAFLPKTLLACGLAGTIAITSGCGMKEKEPTFQPVPAKILEEYINVEYFWEYGIRDGEVTKFYKGENINYIIDQETYNVRIFARYINLGGDAILYDIETDTLIGYSGVGGAHNVDYCDKLLKDGYSIPIDDVILYDEAFPIKPYYTLEELKEAGEKMVVSLKEMEAQGYADEVSKEKTLKR